MIPSIIASLYDTDPRIYQQILNASSLKAFASFSIDSNSDSISSLD